MLESVRPMLTPILLTTYVLLTIAVFAKLAVIKTQIANLNRTIEKDGEKNEDDHTSLFNKSDKHVSGISENKSAIAGIGGTLNEHIKTGGI